MAVQLILLLWLKCIHIQLHNLVTSVRKTAKASNSFVICVRASVRLSSRMNNSVSGRIIVRSDIWGFCNNLLRKLKIDENLTKITGILNNDLCTFMIIPGWILLRMRKFSDKICRENQNTHFMFNNIFPKIMTFMRQCGKIWYSRTCHSWQYNMVHVFCMLGN